MQVPRADSSRELGIAGSPEGGSPEAQNGLTDLSQVACMNWVLKKLGRMDSPKTLPKQQVGLTDLSQAACMNCVLSAAWLLCPQLGAAPSLPPKGTGLQ